MARCQLRWRNVLICICTPCIFVALLLLYIMVSVCMTLSGVVMPRHKHGLEDSHYIAPGNLRNQTFAPIPVTFWELNLTRGAFWNRLQHTIDRRFNPILNPGRIGRGSYKRKFLEKSFAEIGDMESNDFKELPQLLQEFVRHMKIRDYPVIYQPHSVCGAGEKDEKEPPLIIMAIKSSELNFRNRQAIRQTWGREGWVAGRRNDSSAGEEGGYVHRVFLLGKEETEEVGVNLSELLKIESLRYGDILQWDFKDTFFNLTLKDVLFWRWFSRNCNARFVFKGDDDVFVNTPNLITYLLDRLKVPDKQSDMRDFMVGDVINTAMPDRNKKSKYFIPHSFYKGFYPSYAGGGGLVYSGLLARRLHIMSERVQLFPIDDVYVGMCMIRLNARLIHHPAFLTFDFPGKDEEKPCVYHTILMVHKRSPKQMTELWADLQETQAQCHNVSLRAEEKVVKKN